MQQVLPEQPCNDFSIRCLSLLECESKISFSKHFINTLSLVSKLEEESEFGRAVTRDPGFTSLQASFLSLFSFIISCLFPCNLYFICILFYFSFQLLLARSEFFFFCKHEMNINIKELNKRNTNN